ncbi:monovalent cation:H+ antiporter, CPA1 family [Leifsonia sp. 98AMF]|uniref:cation:proton antiporter domain-containing protein n=1 Tax=unclassified Leifsonia TaxID=2663824 RepID=UPI00087B51D8|nr:MULTISPECIES: cation:proton antiporter [unclassified Leifsonia]SDH18037.1 monovalent cation:H+ antiporter, CPA1 family [Leifsonia sp. 197AMF]SDJ20408.1 monovalent cation:H+ antiporter, CPA1 family [Leifsonia sp. 466MF]SDJ45169.1 monovalent cation:H+ antiporter, CPA1 family [Leifsonia sp. 157MF]SDN41876.1 monovalent cation:H+ antiporter, CPA1 family [Leifsonia sp. 509MF]SEM78552.1 monovalent cation:H+ antiporter, CPA1 family [Leifsonia sp. 467MF]
MEVGLVIGVLAVLTIAAATTFGPRFGVASPLILMVIGILVSLLPFVPAIELEPEWILAGVLPPLLYSASVSMPAMNFRREFGAIGGLSVLLVIVSSVLLGLFFAWVIPGLGLGWGIALGAIVSPTDAVATGIVKRAGVSPRVVAILEGESLLNDATALVLLRAAVAAAGASFTVGAVTLSFVYSVLVAVVFGVVVGWLNLLVRARVKDATVNTVISFTVPFLASIPAEALGASGLVAAVVAGLVTGSRAPRVLSPEHRLSDAQNWRTVELILEGLIFLTMGLELFGIVQDVQEDHSGVAPAIGIAAGALLLTILVRAAFVAPLLALLARRSKRRQRIRPRLEQLQEHLTDPEAVRRGIAERIAKPGEQRALAAGSSAAAGEVGDESGAGSGADVPADTSPDPAPAASSAVAATVVPDPTFPDPAFPDPVFGDSAGRRPLSPKQAERRRRLLARRGIPTVENLTRFGTRLRRLLADIEYFTGAPLGWREGTIVVWAGMRGAVTVAAAQSLPDNTPGRSVLVLIAFLVATGSLLLQGGTLGLVLKAVKPAAADPEAERQERRKLMELLYDAAKTVPVSTTTERTPEAFAEHKRARLAQLRAQRDALLDARDDGAFSADVLAGALSNLDADEISIDLKGDPTEATG